MWFFKEKKHPKRERNIIKGISSLRNRNGLAVLSGVYRKKLSALTRISNSAKENAHKPREYCMDEETRISPQYMNTANL